MEEKISLLVRMLENANADSALAGYEKEVYRDLLKWLIMDFYRIPAQMEDAMESPEKLGEMYWEVQKEIWVCHLAETRRNIFKGRMPAKEYGEFCENLRRLGKDAQTREKALYSDAELYFAGLLSVRKKVFEDLRSSGVFPDFSRNQQKNN